MQFKRSYCDNDFVWSGHGAAHERTHCTERFLWKPQCCGASLICGPGTYISTGVAILHRVSAAGIHYCTSPSFLQELYVPVPAATRQSYDHEHIEGEGRGGDESHVQINTQPYPVLTVYCCWGTQ